MVVLMLILDEESPLTADIKFPTCTHGWIIEKNITDIFSIIINKYIMENYKYF